MKYSKYKVFIDYHVINGEKAYLKICILSALALYLQLECFNSEQMRNRAVQV